MAALAKASTEEMNPRKTFAPEADFDFEPVSEDKIAAMRESIAERFGIGQGKLAPVEEPNH